MDEIVLKINAKNGISKGEELEFQIENNTREELEYKFILGNAGIWSTIKEFSSDSICKWVPNHESHYIVMVQARKVNSSKPFNYMCKEEFSVGEDNGKIIKEVFVNSYELQVGEKIDIVIRANKKPTLYRFWKSGERGWELIRDYGTENNLVLTASKEGTEEILVECKEPSSENKFDDFYKFKYKVIERVKVEISNFKCLTEELLSGEELNFQVECGIVGQPNILYKFLKINQEGKAVCIQDYSSKTIVSFKEEEPGEYRLLCLAKDIYSNKEYDDRAVMVYNVKAYNPIKIKSFTSDLASPQVVEADIVLKAFVDGGKNLLYRFKIDGIYGEDSGYTKNSTYLWRSKAQGEYKITLFVKDASYEGEYEDKSQFEYFIDTRSEKIVRIVDVVVDKDSNYLVEEPINIKVMAEGGTALKYSFIVYKDKKEIDRIGYGTSNWVNFTPMEAGEYAMEVRVKNKYSTKEYDSHSMVYLKVLNYIPGKIDYILFPYKEFHMVSDEIELEAVVQNGKDSLIKYVTKINGHVVEETEYTTSKKLKLTPKIPGKYTFELYAKNKKCINDFDSKKEFHIYINDSVPVTRTKITSNKLIFNVQEEINFSVESAGGKDVCYEFYLMEGGNWIKTQGYSKKSYYNFIPFSKGGYKVLVLARSYHKKVAYEDYDIIEFSVS